MKIVSIHITIIALLCAGVLPVVCAMDHYSQLRSYLRTPSSEKTPAQNLRFLGEGSCSPEGEKATDCGAQARDDRADICCPGLKCGGEKGKYCIKAKNADGDGADKEKAQCSPKGEKATDCGAQARDDRADICCPGLKCGGENGKYCVKINDDDGDAQKDDGDAQKDDGDDGDDGDAQKDDDEKADEERSGLSCYEAPDIDRSGDKDLGFLWHLYYEPCIKWAYRGYDFCVMCRNYKCEKDDFVVTSHCNANQDHFRWEWKEVGDGIGLMKTKSTDLCLEGDGSWDFILRPCDEDNDRQHFQGYNETAKFQLLPKNHQRSGNPQCMTMLHHPLAANDDDGEMIIDQPCYKAEKTETAYWTADYRPKVKEELKKADKVCRNEKCGECEGYCEKDSECKGDLYCYERGGKGWRTNLESGFDPNPWAQIPGCNGFGRHGKNYCSKEKLRKPIQRPGD